jgi:hypothetical protein
MIPTLLESHWAIVVCTDGVDECYNRETQQDTDNYLINSGLTF